LFGTTQPEEIWALALAACPDAVDCFHYEASVSAVLGVLLRDGTRAALKFHRREEAQRLPEVARLQAYLAERGFPCPRRIWVRGRTSLEEWRDVGDYRDAHEPEVRRAMARTVVRLVALADEL